MSKRVKIKITTDANGDAKTHYECEGFGGSSCETIADLMSVLGSVESTKTTDEAYNQEVPLGQPNENCC